MKYKVTFRRRFDENGDPSAADNPTALVDVAEGVVEDAEYIQTLEPPSVHWESMEPAEDDEFLAFGTETWVYDVADGREKEFRDALVNSEVVLEFEVLSEESERA